jgi:hypothetical protein
VVDADDRKRGVGVPRDGEGGVVEGGVFSVDGDGVVGVCGVAADVADDAEVSVRVGEGGCV